MTPPSDQPQPTVPWWLVIAAFAGWVAGLLGIYWDESWHTDIGRDTFFSPPHLLLYAGVGLVGLALAAWTAIGLRRRRLGKPTVVALVGGALTIASAPIDDWWHNAFGRDAVVWSPPHMAGVVGVVLLVAGLLIEGVAFPGRRSRTFAAAASAGLLAAMLIPVYEYQGDVPQFPIALYLPLLTGLSMLAFAIIDRLRPGARLAATQTATIYTGLMILVVAALGIMGHSLPVLPVILAPALVFDLTARSRPRVVRALFYTAATFGIYVPYLDLVYRGVFVDAGDVAVGLPPGLLLSWAALAAVDGEGRIRVPATAVAAGLLLLVPVTALAHDPGWGEEIGEVRLTAGVSGDTAEVTGEIGGVECSSLDPVRLVARRAGATVESPLRLSGCTLSATIDLPDRGRWFLYAELDRGADPVEAWLAVQVGEETDRFQRDTTLYQAGPAASPPSKYLVGSILYLIALGSLGYMVGTVRGVRPQPAGPG